MTEEEFEINPSNPDPTPSVRVLATLDKLTGDRPFVGCMNERGDVGITSVNFPLAISARFLGLGNCPSGRADPPDVKVYKSANDFCAGNSKGKTLEVIFSKLNLYTLMKPGSDLFGEKMIENITYPFHVNEEVIHKIIKKNEKESSHINMYL